MLMQFAKLLSLCCLALIVAAPDVDTATPSNVLAVLPSVWKSHYLFARSILRALPAERFNITLISPYANSAIEYELDENEQQAEDQRLGNWLELPVTGLLENWQDMRLSFNVEEKRHNVIERVTRLIYASTSNVDDLLGQQAVRQILQSQQHFDLIVIDLLLSDALLGLGPLFQAPMLVISASGSHAWLDQLLGNPRNPALDPSSFLPYTEYMSIWQRCINTLMLMFERLTYQFFHKITQQAIYLKHFQPLSSNILPHHVELAANISLILLNTHVVLQYPRAYLPNMLEVAGAHLKPITANSNLPQHLREHIESAPGGQAVYVSLGANARTADMSRDKLNALLLVFAQLKDVHFLLKWETLKLDAEVDVPKNVLLSAWFPQQAILSHTNVAAFISTCGLLSVVEAIKSLTPLLAIPLLPEQEATASRLAARGVALVIPYDDITYDALLNGIEQLLFNDSYSKSLRRLEQQFVYNCDTPLALAIQHINRLVDGELDNNILQSPASRLSFWEVELLDVRTILTLGLGLALAIPFLLTCCILRRSYNNQTVFEQKVQNSNDASVRHNSPNLVSDNGVLICNEPLLSNALRFRRRELHIEQPLET